MKIIISTKPMNAINAVQSYLLLAFVTSVGCRGTVSQSAPAEKQNLAGAGACSGALAQVTTPFVAASWTPTMLTPAECNGTGASRNPNSQLTTIAAHYSDRGTWEKRARIVREGVQKKMNLFPWPARTPLKAVIHSRKVNVALGITIENVSFESVPGLFVTGNLYRPLTCKGSPPGILRVHGHGKAIRFEPDFQRHCAAMASMGAVVFGYEMVGKGESNQVAHCFPEAILAAQTWNTIRAVDFLLSLGVDHTRIGITGESGGGTQSYMATALDPRIGLSMPAVIVGGTDEGVWMGGCNCEATGMGVHQDLDPANDVVDYETNAIDLAALTAPRFQLILSDSADRLASNAPTSTMPYLKRIYGFYGAEANVANFHDNTGHNYFKNKREASYRFLIEKFHMGPDVPDEDKYVVYSPEQLRSFTTEHPRPAYALMGPQAIAAALAQKR